MIVLFALAAACVIYFLLSIGARENPSYKDSPAPTEIKK
jgi:hypothetical protein